MELSTDDAVQVITLDPDHQVLNPDTVAAWSETLDRVEAVEGPSALVITGSGKSFHQGLDLEAVLAMGKETTPFLKTVHQLFGRLLRLDMATITAINGHAQAGGAMLAQCADRRIMRADRGWFRLPEVELGMPFTIVMNDLLAARLPQPALHALMVLGRSLGGTAAAEAAVVDQAVPGEGGPLAAAVEQAGELARHRGPTIRTIRTGLYADLLATIDADAGRGDLFIR